MQPVHDGLREASPVLERAMIAMPQEVRPWPVGSLELCHNHKKGILHKPCWNITIWLRIQKSSRLAFLGSTRHLLNSMGGREVSDCQGYRYSLPAQSQIYSRECLSFLQEIRFRAVTGGRLQGCLRTILEENAVKTLFHPESTSVSRNKATPGKLAPGTSPPVCTGA